ncbi:Spo0E family sporulation regulatory protein-aspartic acid phosphatase [Clostridium botulinum]|nr:Spo0E family sporulation regulatory protein-aspartic acid phosphatase [Clostridium botulinum]NFA95937.1 Spo0E family sporulation regulatory protein-aspartic acid phosphatase [Clostridium botulinum]NFB53043.1 Spo0E family sporulation regulatory protein-aspartic acid phosphatase [Clostridium botulinum]NFB56533.1 Spo0E family sporulation regulatory protein-aspartic acid phosphatase [Clostridium botulinum]NFB60820.1 Spo0E family sporulation regulatory protein-aspartic acid phosphatase [Clostridi
MILKYSKKSLCEQMDIVRQALYEVSITLDDEERDEEKILSVSREMDELILKYMKFGKED